jgi:hypothetical protein
MKRNLTTRNKFDANYVLKVLKTTSPDLLDQTPELRRVLEEACHLILMLNNMLGEIGLWYRDAPEWIE